MTQDLKQATHRMYYIVKLTCCDAVSYAAQICQQGYQHHNHNSCWWHVHANMHLHNNQQGNAACCHGNTKMLTAQPPVATSSADSPQGMFAAPSVIQVLILGCFVQHAAAAAAAKLHVRSCRQVPLLPPVTAAIHALALALCAQQHTLLLADTALPAVAAAVGGSAPAAVACAPAGTAHVLLHTSAAAAAAAQCFSRSRRGGRAHSTLPRDVKVSNTSGGYWCGTCSTTAHNKREPHVL